MKILFSIHYFTNPGQQIYLCGSPEIMGKWNSANALPMNYMHYGLWQIEINIEESAGDPEYKYLLKDEFGFEMWEDGPNRNVKRSETNKSVCFANETWRLPSVEEKVLYTSAFSKVLMRPRAEAKSINLATAKKTLQFKIQVPRIGNKYRVCVLGNTPQLGDWDIKNPFVLGCGEDFPLWTGSIDVSGIKKPLHYKYGIYNIEKKMAVTLEEGHDRELNTLPQKEKEYHYIQSDERFRYPLGNWKAAGVAVPVFSLRTDKGFGAGDFRDLIDFIDWAKQANLKMIQLLPVNETIATHSWLDSYPYKSISVFALHPIYLNLEKLGTPKDKKIVAEYNEHRVRLNKETDVNYPEVLDLKSRYYKIIFDQVKDEFFTSAEYKAFFNQNKDWLVPYAAYAFLRDKNDTADFRKWSEHCIYKKKDIEKLCSPDSPDWDDISIHYFLQFHLDKQLSEASKYAHEKGVVLKGDIPIGISPNSVEAWTEPHLFNLNAQAGAPPDDFSAKGQNWGFPTYNWGAMQKEGYSWWRKRLHKMEEYFDAYRIDHILGFFRIWEIPLHAVEGLLGYFNPSIPMSAQEIEQYGIHFDYNRLVMPYIHEHILHPIFGDWVKEVKKKFLDSSGLGSYTMKEAFNTQQKVNQYFLKDIEEEELTDKDRQIRNGLFDLIANVLFVQTGENEWHPRIAFHFTSSYADLDAYTKERLNQIYTHYYYKRHDDFWYHKGMEKLPAIISASKMLVCGEDLGMVPECVPPVMKQLGILSLEIQRMSKNPKKIYAHPADAPYMSVCTTSTHDMPTIRGWWESNREAIQQFFNRELGNFGEAPYFAEPWLCQQMITQHLYSPAMWTTFPIQDLLAMDGDLRWKETHREQINQPSNVRHHWKYRMHQSIDELKSSENFNKLLQTLIEQSGRNTDY